MANRLRRMPLPPKMPALQREVRCHTNLVTGRGSKNSAVVADTQAHSPRPGPGPRSLTPDRLDQLKLTRNYSGWRWAGQEKLPANRIPATFLPRHGCNFYDLATRRTIERFHINRMPCYPLDLHNIRRL